MFRYYLLIFQIDQAYTYYFKAFFFICDEYNFRIHIVNIFSRLSKVENILKGSLDSIPSPSPSVNIQIIGGKVWV